MPTKWKLLFGILLCLLLFFAVAVAQFYYRRTANASGTTTTADVTTTSDHIFQDSTTGLYGLADAEDNVTIEPEWKSLYFIGEDGVAAAKKIGNTTVTGVLDREGDVIVPFVYQDLSYVNEQVIVGSLPQDDLYFLYDNTFHKLTDCAWNAYQWKDSVLTLQRNTDTFSYEQTEDEIALCAFDLQRAIQRRTVSIYCEESQTVSLFSVEVWCSLGDDLSTFLKAYQRNDMEDASVFLTADAVQQLEPLLVKNTAEKWRPDWTSSIAITSQTDILGTVVYATVAVERGTESAVLQVAFQAETATGALQITGLQILQETA